VLFRSGAAGAERCGGLRGRRREPLGDLRGGRRAAALLRSGRTAPAPEVAEGLAAPAA